MDASVAYQGPSSNYGSGDTSCADHNIAWRVRNLLGLDHMAGVGGVSGDATRPDNIVYDIVTLSGLPIAFSPSGWRRATCSAAANAISKTLPVIP